MKTQNRQTCYSSPPPGKAHPHTTENKVQLRREGGGSGGGHGAKVQKQSPRGRGGWEEPGAGGVKCWSRDQPG